MDAMLGVQGIAAQFTQQGRTITHYPGGTGAGTDITGIVMTVKSAEQDERFGLDHLHDRSVIITTDPSGAFGGVAAPKVTDEVTIDNVRYAVKALEDHGATAKLMLTLKNAQELSKQRFRGSR
jgi:hypothetical protein